MTKSTHFMSFHAKQYNLYYYFYRNHRIGFVNHLAFCQEYMVYADRHFIFAGCGQYLHL